MLKRIILKFYKKHLKRKWNIKTDYCVSLLTLDYINDYKKHKSHILKVHSIHKKGFTWDDWHISGLSKSNYKSYLKSAQYYAMHPLNGKYSQWIDDKLTLKYIFSETVIDKYMPKYFYQIDNNGNILGLQNCPNNKLKNDINDILTLLKSEKELAFKLESGSLGKGFFKAHYENGVFSLNNINYNENDFITAISKLKGYLITEYFHPHKDLLPFSLDAVNCIRYLIARDKNGNIKLVKSFIRFGTKQSGFVENYNAGGILCYIDNNGVFSEGNIYDKKSGTNKKVKEHIDTNVKLNAKIPLWDEIQKAGNLISSYLPQMNYLGIDFVVTSKNEVKILEINSLTSLDTLQIDESLLESDSKDFYISNIRK